MPENSPATTRAGSLSIRGVNVYFGGSHALQGVNLNIEQGVLAVVGRNGMGKTTLCKTIMGLVRAASGSIKFAGEELTALPPAEIARLGVGYVPQGRRLWPSLSVDEHLRLAVSGRGAWTIERIYDTFPRLAERKANLGSQLSGGEQQMLAIARALLTNPRALVMDEPTEGLAPVIVAQVEEMLLRLTREGEQTVLLVEQNIGVATAVSETIAIMANGRITRIIDSARLVLDRDLQQRLLGVGRHAQDETDAGDVSGTSASEKANASAGVARAPGPLRVFLSNPKPPTRWSGPVPVAQIIAAARTLSGPLAARNGAEQAGRLELRPLSAGGDPVVVVAGTLDTKGAELRFIRDIIKASGLHTRLVDLSTSGAPSAADVPPHQLAAFSPRGPGGVFARDRGEAVSAMAQAFEAWVRRQSGIVGMIAAGGSGGTSMVAPGMRALTVGVPKLIISTVASGQVGAYVGAADIMMLHSVTDVQGLNSISRQVLANGAHALAGMVTARLAEARARTVRPAGNEPLRPVGITMFGVTTPCVRQVTKALEGEASPQPPPQKPTPATASSMWLSTSSPTKASTARACGR